MKRTNIKKLTLNRETLVSLNADILADVAGGNHVSVPTTGPTLPTSRIGCPSRITVCDPQQTRLFCPQTGTLK